MPACLAWSEAQCDAQRHTVSSAMQQGAAAAALDMQRKTNSGPRRQVRQLGSLPESPIPPPPSRLPYCLLLYNSFRQAGLQPGRCTQVPETFLQLSGACLPHAARQQRT